MRTYFLLGLSAIAISGCTITYEVMLTDTHGQSTDVVDDTTKSDQEVSPNLSIPLSPISI